MSKWLACQEPRQTVRMTSPSTSYKDTLLAELDQIAAQFTRILDVSSIRPRNLPSNFIGFASHRWEPSNDELTAARMATLRNLRDWEPRFRLLFPHPTPEVAKRLKAGFKHFYRWLDRDEGDHSIPATIEAAQTKTAEAIEDLSSLTRLLPDDDWPTRLVVDTNTLLDDPDLTIYATTLGRRYMVHVLPVVLGELDELKRAGRIPEIRDAARRADRRLKGLRDNGNVRVGARVAGDIYAVSEGVRAHRAGGRRTPRLARPHGSRRPARRISPAAAIRSSWLDGSCRHKRPQPPDQARRRRLASPRTTELVTLGSAHNTCPHMPPTVRSRRRPTSLCRDAAWRCPSGAASGISRRRQLRNRRCCASDYQSSARSRGNEDAGEHCDATLGK